MTAPMSICGNDVRVLSESVIFEPSSKPETQAAVRAVFKHRIYYYYSIDYSTKPKRTAVIMPVFPL